MKRHRTDERQTAPWPARFEGLVVRVLIVGLLLMMVTKALAFDDATGLYFGYGDWLDGPVQVKPGPADAATAFLSPAAVEVLTVSLTLVNEPAAPLVALYVNDVAAATFTDAHVTIEVRPGDRLVLAGPGDHRPLIFRITDTSPGLTSPREGTQVTVQGEAAVVGTVRR